MRIIFLCAALVYLVIFIMFSTTKASELNCLVEAVYYEARSEPITAQLAVANVVLERVRNDKFPNTICGVVHQGRYNKKGQPIRHKCMFSYWCDGKPERMKEIEALKTAISVSEMAINGVVVDITAGATHYHATYVRPDWIHSFTFMELGQVGRHIFYLDTRY
jgi:spore germination cell wall hydrolase CwlJ-like protein